MKKSVVRLIAIAFFATLSFAAGAFAEEPQVFDIRKETIADPIERLFINGLYPQLEFTTNYMRTSKDGLNGSSGGELAFNVILSLELNFEDADIQSGGILFFSVETRQGPGISTRRLGDFFGVNNIEGRNFTQISELWYKNERPSGSFLKVGLMDASADFQALESAGDFQNSVFGVIPNIPVPTFPDYGFGGVVNLAVTDNAYLRVGAVDHPVDTTSREKQLFDNTYYGVELGYAPGGEDEAEPEDAYKIGAFFLTGDADSFDGPAHRGNHGVYAAAERNLGDNTAVFLQYSAAPAERNLISGYFGVGFIFDDVLQAADEDSLGIAYGNGAINSYLRAALGLSRGESVLEAYYKFKIAENATLMPNLQWIMKSAGVGKSNLVQGLKFQYAF